jgi:hypothetical protein
VCSSKSEGPGEASLILLGVFCKRQRLHNGPRTLKTLKVCTSKGGGGPCLWPCAVGIKR